MKKYPIRLASKEISRYLKANSIPVSYIDRNNIQRILKEIREGKIK